MMCSRMSKKVNLHVYPTNFTHESRMLKETKSLAESGLFSKIFIGAIWDQNLAELEYLDKTRNVWRVKLLSRKLPGGSLWKALKLLEWQLKIFFKFRKEKVSIFNSHALSVLPLGLLFKSFHGSKLVYDTHELETETQMSGFRKRMSKLLERITIPYTDLLVVVSDSIAGWYKNEYGLNDVHVIRNIPYQVKEEDRSCNVLKKEIGIPDEEMLFIYQGNLGKDRGIELILEAFSRVDRQKHIVFMGFGALENRVKEYEKKFNNVHFHPPVIPDDVIYYTNSADVGVHLIENTCLNHYYCLPNKVFEYIMSGLPLIVSDFPEMGRVVDSGGCGWKVDVEMNTLVSLIDRISWNDISVKRIKCLDLRKRIGWHTEEKVLLHIYRKLVEQTIKVN
ncbi:hypothetical protein D1BOALGB6SA_8714 [Olavius sp. associated proteobacterium Delta 1]|nr:hypothetical protein D1BOALGB6SA_8714 [Olavius sp. associated proteobacterium Delta 1]